ncbi:MAG: LamG domain-containing protein [Deltaproteobacteria bacterium]|nr:LamG domain-containing protein [Deltaproteobacteria bacterium]
MAAPIAAESDGYAVAEEDPFWETLGAGIFCLTPLVGWALCNSSCETNKTITIAGDIASVQKPDAGQDGWSNTSTHPVELITPIGLGILPDGDQTFADPNKMLFHWTVLAPEIDGINGITCVITIIQGGAMVGTQWISQSPGNFNLSISSALFMPRADYCWSVSCSDSEAGMASTSGTACFTTSDRMLAGWWRFDKSDNVEANQISSAGNPKGTVQSDNPDMWVEGVKGLGLKFDGTGDVVKFADPYIFNFDSADFTLMVWVKAEGNGKRQPVISHYTKNAGTGVRYGYGLDVMYYPSVRFWANPPSCEVETLVQDSQHILDGIWHHVAVVRLNQSLQIYVDGETPTVGGLQTNCDGTFSSVAPLFIGGDPDGEEFYTGSVDEFAIYKRGLSQTEIIERCQADAPPGRVCSSSH